MTVLTGLGREGQDTDTSPRELCSLWPPLHPETPHVPSTHLLVLLQGNVVSAPSWVSMKSSLFLWMFSQDALQGGQGRSGCERRTVGSGRGAPA